MIWWKLFPWLANSQEIIPNTDKIKKPGIKAEKERDTDAGTLSGKVMTQLRRITKVNISATIRPMIIPEIIF
ncbi:hypothetical protein D3C72_1729390 [compost metagenome]